jgi:SWI/SNF-related matrix-associated actin-dependent regulator of chromatin subfamily A-like protein 1
VKDYVLELLNNDIKLIVFAHHLAVLDGLEQAMGTKNVKFIRIDGSVTKERRHEGVMKFQED